MFPLRKHQMTYLDKVINDNLFLKTELINTDMKVYQNIYQKIN